jgi:cytochrome c-type biogenesis protein CcmF
LKNFIGLAGYIGLTGAFILCLALIILSALAHFRRFTDLGKLSTLLVHLQTAFLGIAVLSLASLLQIGAFQFEQVFNAVENSMPGLERVGGLWSGQAASLLFWSFIMSAAVSLSVLIAKKWTDQKLLTTVILILEFTLVFFMAPDIFVANPFAKIFRLPSGEIITAIFAPQHAILLVPIDGQGMNPSLRHIAMLLHPPTLYLGLIGLFLPYAFALSALMHGDRSHSWVRQLFPVALVSWVFLTLGMLLGSWWAYTILGWGGYWGWDAVEISGLLPWLLSFGLLHAMRLTLQKKFVSGWVYTFAFAIVILTLFGILITRSGILESVHAYASGPMGPILTALVVIHLATALAALIKNRIIFKEKERNTGLDFSARINRLFFWCILALVIIYLFGQTLPLTSPLILGKTLSFKPADYERASALPLFFLAILTALCPLSVHFETHRHIFWRSALTLAILAVLFPIAALFFTPFSAGLVAGFWAAGFMLLCWAYALLRDIILPILQGKTAKTWAPRLGMAIIHLGFAVMAVGIMGVEKMSTSQSLTLPPGQPAAAAEFVLTYDVQNSGIIEQGNPAYSAAIMVSDTGREQDLVMKAGIIHYVKTGAFYVVPAVKAGFLRDIQLVLDDFPSSAASSLDIHIAFFPLMSWIWAGGALMAVGGLLPLLFRRIQ